MKIRQMLLTLLICLSLNCLLRAQPASSPAGDLLGPKFESQAAGIEFRPPAGSIQVRGAMGTTEVVRFVNDQKKWSLKVSRVLLEKPLPLTIWKDEKGDEKPGMLELTTDQFKTDAPGTEILRQDTTNIGQATVGMMAGRYSFGTETNLIQQAVVRASDLQYFIFAMTCPAPRSGDISADPGLQLAVETFSQVLDSIQLVDQTAIKEDQDQRLFRTRTLFVNLTEPNLRAALAKEMWLRVVRDGKDVGYTYVIEEIGRDLPRKGKPDRQNGAEGVLIGVRSRMLPDAGMQVDSESWLFCTFDRKYEAWSNIAAIDDAKNGKSTNGELGISRRREKPIPDAGMDIGNKRGVSLTEEYKLEVTRLGRNFTTEPIVRDLPPFYLPQALGQLLPRLLPRREAKGFLFATWVGDAGQLMYRYVDVGREQEATLAGKRVRAVPVKDRVGLEGSITTHYIDPEGKYLGSVNEDSKITILPTDAATLEKLWKNVNLTRPGEVEGK